MQVTPSSPLTSCLISIKYILDTNISKYSINRNYLSHNRVIMLKYGKLMKRTRFHHITFRAYLFLYNDIAIKMDELNGELDKL